VNGLLLAEGKLMMSDSQINVVAVAIGKAAGKVNYSSPASTLD